MSKRHKLRRPRDECDELRDELHDARSTIKSLRKRLKTLEQQAHFYERIIDASDEAEEAKPSRSAQCQHCGKGVLELVDLGIRRLEVCNICTHRRVLSK